MNFREFQRINKERCEDPQAFDHPMEEWSIAEWTNALCGEAGEAANISKKIIRLRSAVAKMNKINDTQDELKEKLCQELADTIIYADLCFSRINRTTEVEVAKYFNLKSKELLLPDKFFIK